MAIPGFPLGDQWAALVSPHTVLPSEMQARIDAQMNVIGDYITRFPDGDVCLESGLPANAAVAQGANILFTASVNTGGGYNAATGTYTIPAGGTFFCYCAAIPVSSISLAIGFRTGSTPANPETRGDTTGQLVTMSMILPLATGATIAVERYDAGGGNILAGALFYARRIGA